MGRYVRHGFHATTCDSVEASSSGRWLECPPFLEVDDDGRDVVDTAALAGRQDELLGGLLGVCRALDMVQELTVPDQLPEAVAAQQQAIAGGDLLDEEVDAAELLGGAQG